MITHEAHISAINTLAALILLDNATKANQTGNPKANNGATIAA